MASLHLMVIVRKALNIGQLARMPSLQQKHREMTII